jgi:hypothetical protein
MDSDLDDLTLPEQFDPEIAVPPWPQFVRGYVPYRQSLDQQLPGAAVDDREYAGGSRAADG